MLGLQAQVVATDFTDESGAEATHLLLRERSRPTAIVYDSSILAVAGLGAVQRIGGAVPDDVSTVAWDDALIRQVVHPPMTAVVRDLVSYREAAAAALLAEIAGRGSGDVETKRAVLLSRGTTAPPASRRSAHAARQSRASAPRDGRRSSVPSLERAV
jgi:DNA-binding LacI/PurR family transcriptional regulator